MNFESLGLSQLAIKALEMENISKPTAIQEQAIPLMMAGKDLILQSQTGSGKTLAYLLPIFENKDMWAEKGAKVVVAVPTRELAMQVHHVVETFAKHLNIPLKSATLFGGVNVNLQLEKLKEKPQIIIGTSDKILDMIKKKKIPAHTVKTFIIDEADKHLNKNNLNALKNLRKTFMKYTQVVYASASYSPSDLEQAKILNPEATIIKAQVNEEIPDSIKHYFITCEKRDKLEILRKMMGIMKFKKNVIFINELEVINVAVEKLQFHEQNCKSIHSGNTKIEREKHIREFASGKLNSLVATDVAARGLHIDDIDCVFSFTMPEDPTDYLHRAGRTGRNGAKGMSVCIVTDKELPLVTKAKNRFGIEINEIKMRNGEITMLDKNKKIIKLF